MENASKALILAGEILIGILVLTLIAYAIITFGQFSASMNEKMSESKITTFNNKFYAYSGRADITAQEIASLVNFSKKENDSNELALNDTSNYYIKVMIDGKSIYNDTYMGIKTQNQYSDETIFKNAINNFIMKYNTNYFYCNAKIDINDEKKTISIEKSENQDIKVNENTKLVYSINFSNINSSKYNYNVLTSKDYTINK